MSTLKEILQQRRAAENPDNGSFESAEAPVRSLQIRSWDGENWVFPWSHFSAARHHRTGEGERMVLLFANHEVVLDGARLALLLPEVARFHLDCLRDIPANFRAQADTSIPFISRVSVRPMTDAAV